MKLLLRNARKVVTCSANGNLMKHGPEMNEVREIENADILVEDGIIEEIGKGIVDSDCEIVDVSDRLVIPGFIDPHTHLIFAGSREKEFEMRARGATYSEIAAGGGGILETVRSTREMPKSKLRNQAARRLEKMLRWGTTSIEIKTGYGLDFKNEVKMLETAAELKDESIQDLVVTFLGAHAFPPEFANDRPAYVKLITDEMIPYASKKKLADFCDVFCDSDFFSLEQAKTILSLAAADGMKLKMHADELSSNGAADLAVELGAVSVDHLENISNSEIDRLARSNSVGVVLPAVAAYLRTKPAPGREMIDRGCAIALATDFNPGTSMVDNMQTVMWLAVAMNSMSVEEALNAATINAAAAIGISDRTGSIEVGKKADMLIVNAPDYAYLPYHFTENRITNVVKDGKILEFS